MTARYNSFKEFYPYYLSEHRNRNCRRLHFAGTLLVIVTFLVALLTARMWLFLLLPVLGYSFAWAGHFLFEKNRPATFSHPLYSLMADFVMFAQMLSGRLRMPD